MIKLRNSELILNSDGSIYHLGLKPEHIASTVITVGDPDRVEEITRHFDKVDFTIQNREFKTIGGSIGSRPITVISTGIGTDNIDIVLNELAFLLNFDLSTLVQLPEHRSVDIIRVGTSGSTSLENPLDSLVYSKYAISFDDLFKFYNHSFDSIEFDNHAYPVIPCSSSLVNKFKNFKPSLTLTAKGFYGPQFRQSYLAPKYELQDLQAITYKGNEIGNIEMETAGIYGLSTLLGFEAISLNAILANRVDGSFSSNPSKTIDKLIESTLDSICR